MKPCEGIKRGKEQSRNTNQKYFGLVRGFLHHHAIKEVIGLIMTDIITIKII